VRRESPINVGVMKELREYQSKLGFKKVTDGFELVNSRPLFSAQGNRLPEKDHTLHVAHALHTKYVDHALHCVTV